MAVSWINIDTTPKMAFAESGNVWAQLVRAINDRRIQVGFAEYEFSYLGTDPENGSGLSGELKTEAIATLIEEMEEALENVVLTDDERVDEGGFFVNSDWSDYTGAGSTADGGINNASKTYGNPADWGWWIGRFREICDALYWLTDTVNYTEAKWWNDIVGSIHECTGGVAAAYSYPGYALMTSPQELPEVYYQELGFRVLAYQAVVPAVGTGNWWQLFRRMFYGHFQGLIGSWIVDAVHVNLSTLQQKWDNWADGAVGTWEAYVSKINSTQYGSPNIAGEYVPRHYLLASGAGTEGAWNGAGLGWEEIGESLSLNGNALPSDLYLCAYVEDTTVAYNNLPEINPCPPDPELHRGTELLLRTQVGIYGSSFSFTSIRIRAHSEVTD